MIGYTGIKEDQQQPAFTGRPAQLYAGSKAVQMKDNRPQSVIQKKLVDGMANAKSEMNPIQKKENNTGLPDKLKSGVENLSGHSMDDVKVHYNSAQPAQLNAHAYAQGTDIHIAPGQEKHLPHEAWHVVQQKQGRVRPTMQMKGNVKVNDAADLEQEADLMGSTAMHTGQALQAGELAKGNTQDAGLQRKENPESAPAISNDGSLPAALIVEDAATNLVPGQMKKTDFLEKLYQSLYSTGSEVYRGTNLTVAGCPFIEYWFSHYANESSKHIEQVLLKYIGTPAVASTQELIHLITVRARKGFKEQVKSGAITELPADVPKTLQGHIEPATGATVQRKSENIQGGAGVSINNGTGKPSMESNVKSNVVQLGKKNRVANEELTDRGGAKKQDKTWVKGVTTSALQFIHCGSAPLDAELDPDYGKEDINVASDEDAPKKFILGFPFGEKVPDDTYIASKPLQNMWSVEERPHAFIFEIPAGSVIYSNDGAKPKSGTETGFPFTITRDMIRGRFVLRQAEIGKNKATADKTYYRVHL